MMSSKSTPRFMDSVAHCNLPTLDRTVGTTLSAGLPKLGDLPRYPDEPVNYSGTYFTYCLRGPEGTTDLPPHWSPPGTCLQRSPIVHPPDAGQHLTKQIAHRPENMAHCVESSPPVATRDQIANQKPVYYDSVPEKQGSSVPRIHDPTAVRKHSVGGASISPPREGPVALAIPKPIYGHNPCCTEHGCTSGPCYGVERSAPRVHPNAYDEEWMLQYGPLSLLQRKEREALLQQGLLQMEQSAVRFPLRGTRPEGYHVMRPAGPMRFPPFVEQNYSTFPYTSPARSHLSPSSDLFHRLQFPSKVYHGLPPPPSCTYEDMQQMAFTNSGIPHKMYPNHSPPIPRYTQLPQRPVFYYPHGNVEMENGVPYKGTSRKVAANSPPAASNQVPSNPPRPCLEPQPTLSNFSAPCPTAPMNPPFPSNCDLSPFQVYRTQAGIAGQKRTFAEGPGAPLLVRHVERPVDYSMQRAWVTSPLRELCRRSPGAFQPMQQPLSDYRSSDHMSMAKCKMLSNHSAEDGQASPKEAVPLCNVGCRPEGTGSKPAPCWGSAEHASSLRGDVIISKDHRANENGADKLTATELPNLGQSEKDLYEAKTPSKWQEEKGSDQKLIERQHSPPSPPMPVINKVFSLAPYKAYLQASGMLPLQNRLQNIEKHCTPKDLKLDAHSRERDSPQGLKETTHKVIPAICSQPSPEPGPVCMLDSHKIKTEKVTPEDTDRSIKSEIGCEGGHQGLKEAVVKEEETDEVTSSSDSVLDLRMKKGELNVSASDIQTSTGFSSSSEYRVDTSNGRGVVGTLALNHNGKHSVLAAPPLKLASPTLAPPETKVFFQHIPLQCVKQSTFKIIMSDVLRSHLSRAPEVPQPAPETKSPTDANRQARHRFMEMHQNLFRLISASVSRTPEQELRAWLVNFESQEVASPPAKSPRISNLLGAAAREAWLRCRDTAAGLALVVSQLEDYAASQQCPFPHVIRTGTLFIPMLVVKECLFPQIPGALIDRVLQEHHVELRPTTLSEERHLMQLQRRPCSSKLRRLLSLKHLPDIYPDMLTLFYHGCVNKHLGLVLSTPVKTERLECSGEAEGSRSGTSTQSTTSRPSSPNPPKRLKDTSRRSCLRKHKRKGRRWGTSKKLLVKEKLPPGEDFEYSVQSESWSIVNSFSRDGEASQSPHSENLETMNIKLEENSEEEEEVSQRCKEEPESTWGPVTSDDFSSGNSDTETDRASLTPYPSQPPETTISQSIPKSHSGMILKLRKVLFNKGPFGRDSSYQPVPDRVQPVRLGVRGGRTGRGAGEEQKEKELGVARRMRPRVAQRRRRGDCYTEPRRPTRSSSKVFRLRSSPMQLKYCPRLSACHGGQHRSRWVLRSAVQTARRAMKNRYPDLVGKRIRHLYEENDKSEVWYRGVVVRIHEPHLNPLKTVFEVKYDSEPEWQYYLELLMDYKKGWLKVED